MSRAGGTFVGLSTRPRQFQLLASGIHLKTSISICQQGGTTASFAISEEIIQNNNYLMTKHNCLQQKLELLSFTFVICEHVILSSLFLGKVTRILQHSCPHQLIEVDHLKLTS
jgi:hypothetical protein